MLNKILNEHLIRPEGLTLLQDLAIKGSLAGLFHYKAKQVFADETIKEEEEKISLKCYRWFNTFDKNEKPHTNIFNDLYMLTLIRDSDRTATTALRHFLLKNNLIEKDVFYKSGSLIYPPQQFVRDTYAHFIVEHAKMEEAPLLLHELDDNGISLETKNSIGITPEGFYDMIHKRNADIVAKVVMHRGGPYSETDLMLAQGKYRTALHDFFDIMHIKKMNFDDEEESVKNLNSTPKSFQETPKLISSAQTTSFARRVLSSICSFVRINGD